MSSPGLRIVVATSQRGQFYALAIDNEGPVRTRGGGSYKRRELAVVEALAWSRVEGLPFDEKEHYQRPCKGKP